MRKRVIEQAGLKHAVAAFLAIMRRGLIPPDDARSLHRITFIATLESSCIPQERRNPAAGSRKDENVNGWQQGAWMTFLPKDMAKYMKAKDVEATLKKFPQLAPKKK